MSIGIWHLVATKIKNSKILVDIGIVSLVLLSYVLFYTVSALRSYRWGMNPELPSDYIDKNVIYFFCYLAVNVFLFVMLCIRMTIAITRFGIGRLFLYIGYFTFSILFVVFCRTVTKPIMWYIADGFFVRMEKEADIITIRQWLETYNIDKQAEHHEITSDDWIPELKRLNPKYIYIEPEESIRVVRLVWGGPFVRHWGLVIGPEDMEIPQSDIHRGGERRIKLSAGVYVWHDVR